MHPIIIFRETLFICFCFGAWSMYYCMTENWSLCTVNSSNSYLYTNYYYSVLIV